MKSYHIIFFATAVFFFIISFLYFKQANNDVLPQPGQTGEISIIGQHICLPHKDTKGPQTLECAFGLKANNGNYYGLDFGGNWNLAASLDGSSQIRVKGKLVNLTEEDAGWLKYNIQGLIEVESVTKLN